MDDKIKHSLSKLIDYCTTEGFKGYDPYDGLNSTLFQSVPFLSRSRLARLAWIQFFKRSPFNFRPLVGIKKEYNPKALGLFLSGYCNLYKVQPGEESLNMIHFFAEKLIALSNREYSGDCWGYNFDWQAKAFFQPKYTPTVVATSFIGNAFLDAYEITGNEHYLKIARSACDFIITSLNRTYDSNGNFAFSYSPLDKTVVFNATLLGSRLLSRVFSHTHESELIIIAGKSVAFCCTHQKIDGSWSYGTLSHHRWIDNFHTGYNLMCLADYINISEDNRYLINLEKGFDYYISNFFTSVGIPKYYNNSIYPVDIHAPAQMVISLSKTGKFRDYKYLMDKVLYWTIDNMQSEKGYFYFQINKYFSSRIPYMRWAQAWMFYALSEHLWISLVNVQEISKL